MRLKTGKIFTASGTKLALKFLNSSLAKGAGQEIVRKIVRHNRTGLAHAFYDKRKIIAHHRYDESLIWSRVGHGEKRTYKDANSFPHLCWKKIALIWRNS